MSKDAGNQILRHLKNTKKPRELTSKRWIEKIKEFLEARDLVDLSA